MYVYIYIYIYLYVYIYEQYNNGIAERNFILVALKFLNSELH